MARRPKIVRTTRRDRGDHYVVRGRHGYRLRRSIFLRFNRLVGGYVPVHPVVLVVDDDPDIRRSVVQALEDDGMMGIGAASGQEALRILNRDPTVGVLLTDIMMPG